MKFSLIYSFFNQLPYLAYQLEAHKYIYENSLFRDFEFIICDDGSSDGTKEFVEKNKKEYPFPIKYLWQEKKGFRLAASRNNGIRVSKGEYIYLTDGDSFPTADTYIAFEKEIEKYGKKIAYMGQRWKIDWKKIPKDKPYNPKDLYAATIDTVDWRVPHGCCEPGKRELPVIPPYSFACFSGANVVFPGDDLRKIEWAPDDWNGFGYDDYVCALRWLAIIGKPIFPVMESVAFHIQHPNTMADPKMKARLEKMNEEYEANLKENFKGWYHPKPIDKYWEAGEFPKVWPEFRREVDYGKS